MADRADAERTVRPMSKSRLVALLTAGALVIASALYVGVAATGNSASFKTRLASFEKCTLERPNNDSREFRAFYKLQQTCVETSLGKLESVEQVKAAMALLYANSKKNDYARSACHDLAHAVGSWVFDTIGDEGLIQGYTDCGFGYYHGFMQRSMEKIEPMARVAALQTFCEEYSDLRLRPDVKLSSEDTFQIDETLYFFCSHGVGHSIAAHVDTIEEGIEICEYVDKDFEGRPNTWDRTTVMDGRTYNMERPSVECYAGFMNEHMLQRMSRQEQPEEVSEVVSTCEQVPNEYRVKCAGYMSNYSKIKLTTLVEECNTIGNDLIRMGCWSGVGFRGADILFDLNVDPSAKDLLGGYSSDLLLSDPAGAAAFIDRLCRDDEEFTCAERVILETSQRSQRPEAMAAICELVKNEEHRWFCSNAVGVTASLQGGEDQGSKPDSPPSTPPQG